MKRVIVLSLAAAVLSNTAIAQNCEPSITSADNVGFSFCIGVAREVYQMQGQDPGSFADETLFDLAEAVDRSCGAIYLYSGSVEDSVSNGTLMMNMARLSGDFSEAGTKWQLCQKLLVFHSTR